jgi:poly(A) polymerase
VLGFLAHPRFRAAYDFLLLRAQAGGEDPAIARWWTELLALTPDQQRERVGTEGASGDEPGPPRRRRRRRGGRRNATPPVES